MIPNSTVLFWVTTLLAKSYARQSLAGKIVLSHNGNRLISIYSCQWHVVACNGMRWHTMAYDDTLWQVVGTNTLFVVLLLMAQLWPWSANSTV